MERFCENSLNLLQKEHEAEVIIIYKSISFTSDKCNRRLYEMDVVMMKYLE